MESTDVRKDFYHFPSKNQKKKLTMHHHSFIHSGAKKKTLQSPEPPQPEPPILNHGSLNYPEPWITSHLSLSPGAM